MSTWTESLRPPQRLAAEWPARPGNLVPLTGAFLAFYLAFHWISDLGSLAGNGWTLWNPCPALSLALLISFGIRSAPLVFIAGLLAEALDGEIFAGLAGALATALIVTAGYAALAFVLRRASHAAEGFPRALDVGIFAVATALGVALIAGLSSLALVLMHRLAPRDVAQAVYAFWIGDTAGIMGLFPALMTAHLVPVHWRETAPLPAALDMAGFVAGSAVSLWILFGFPGTHAYHLFYLLLLPVLWIGLRHGLAWSALAVFIQQSALVGVVSVNGLPIADVADFRFLSLGIATSGLLLGAVVSERRRVERRLREQQSELSRAARAAIVGALGSAVVHEISQPLATAAAYAHACRLMLAAGSQPLLPATMEKIEKEVLRAGAIIERLRDVLARGEARFCPIDLEAATLDIVGVLADEARAREVHVSVDAATSAPVPADRIQIEQVLVNLIRNAIEAASLGAPVGRRVRVLLRDAAGAVQIDVEDNGPGVPPAMVERLFEPFESSKPKGMGLGLSLSRQIVEAHGGAMFWDRGFTGGARFSFRLPAGADNAAL